MPSRPEPAAHPRNGWAEARSTALTVVVGLALALGVRVLAYQPFTIPSASMEPGLVEGDYILVSKFSYGWSRASLPFSPPVGRGRLLGRDPELGDVVVFKADEGQGVAVIKRVIGLPGDRVQVRGGTVFVNGAAIAQAPARGADGEGPALIREFKPTGAAYLTLDRGPGREGDDTEVFHVPPGRYFVMGDNRDNSLDSRWPAGWGMGFVPAEALVGEAQLILLSWEPGASVLKPWTWVRFQGGRALKRLS
jgi:signal peptidase I